MGLLGDLYSGIDTQKRRLRGLLDDPLGTLALGVERFGEDQRGLLNLQANAYPMAGEKTVLNSPQQIEQFRRELADAAANQGIAAATVWHGSPHKFDKFDSSKIGTGEGSQAYGHGLYLADRPETAGSYANIANKPASRQYGLATAGADQAVLDSLIKLSANKNTGGDVAKLSDLIQQRPALFAKPDAMLQRISEYEGNLAPSNLYKVDLPDEHIAKMLDWDKPLSQQPKAMQRTLEDASWKQMEDAAAKAGMDVFDFEKSIMQSRNYPPTPTGTGEDYIKSLANYLGGMDKASTHLQQQGIPGIRYLDGGSRGAGQGSSNYVLFPGNEGLLSILERNGMKLP